MESAASSSSIFFAMGLSSKEEKKLSYSCGIVAGQCWSEVVSVSVFSLPPAGGLVQNTNCGIPGNLPHGTTHLA